MPRGSRHTGCSSRMRRSHANNAAPPSWMGGGPDGVAARLSGTSLFTVDSLVACGYGRSREWMRVLIELVGVQRAWLVTEKPRHQPQPGYPVQSPVAEAERHRH